jgi:chromosome partitioning protein
MYGILLVMTVTAAERAELVAYIAELREHLQKELAGKILVVAAYKGGAGKSTMAREFAWLTGGNLVDFEYDDGAVSRARGYRHEQFMTAPLVDAMLSGKIPKLTKKPNCPPFVPGHPDWESNTPTEDVIATNLERWADEWQVPVIVDCHPGGGGATRAALSAAHLVVSPVELAELALNAAEGMLERDLRGYPVLLVPNKVKSSPLERQILRLGRMAQKAGATVGSAISRYSWMEERTLNRPLTSADPLPARTVPFVNEIITSVEEAKNLVAA